MKPFSISKPYAECVKGRRCGNACVSDKYKCTGKVPSPSRAIQAIKEVAQKLALPLGNVRGSSEYSTTYASSRSNRVMYEIFRPKDDRVRDEDVNSAYDIAKAKILASGKANKYSFDDDELVITEYKQNNEV